ncbi:MAG: hypothetical protein COU35_01705 [Candidatus Magasanikbacteria bacterium CG10_big_fil_rev_8_21_14_0_10_47_10]|uniref:Glycosyltransferase 2-like domain-containing protein n=1 Tax=Candidatus Magasanikbacteria bacterium CG10_big_fil_rev_8_21_14_0_10_47_10 TaxID=1974652 RepID=A0A2H0TR08_9BACT|nr:MAG: hypothetical protein COU35_01705 [Candidatus Magasanikbacteria bacterium CG10_big_fil_rev_8_21_14_0_10_47_10]
MKTSPMHREKIVLLFSFLTIGAIGVYSIFRVWTVAFTLHALADYSTFQRVVNTVFIIVFWISEMFLVFHSLGYFFTLLVSTFGYRRPYVEYALKDEAAVTILIAAHDEPIKILRKTIIACKYVDYYNYKVVLLDSCTTEESCSQTTELAKDMGIEHFHVPQPRHGAKAGAINEYLAHATTPYIIILDADYRPSRNFVKLLVPQMEDHPDVAFIQTPQFYGNLSNSLISRAAQLQQSIFYEFICEGKSVNGGMFMCGTNLIVRTEALRAVGGFDENSITEDFSTSLTLIKNGWEGRYYDYTTAFGDGPLNMQQFFSQQYRWARGTLGVFMHNLIPILSPFSSLRFRQRYEYFLSGTYYFIGIVWMLFILFPVFYIFFKVPAYFADPFLYVLSYGPYFVFSFALFIHSIVSRRYHFLDWLKSQSLVLITVPVYFRGSVDALLNRKADFTTTQKDVEIDTVDWMRILPQYSLILLVIASVLWGMMDLLLNGFEPSLAINVFWSAYHAFLLTYFLILLYAKGINRKS